MEPRHKGLSHAGRQMNRNLSAGYGGAVARRRIRRNTVQGRVNQQEHVAVDGRTKPGAVMVGANKVSHGSGGSKSYPNG